MHERKYTRIDYVRKHLDDMLKACEDKERSRNGYVHLYGVGQACALISLHRGHDRAYAELAEVAGMLHDYAKYHEGIEENHAEKSAVDAECILREIGQFSEEEIEAVCQAIHNHSEKKRVDTEMDEILKDADEMQHWLRNPVEEYFFQKERTQRIAKEFGPDFGMNEMQEIQRQLQERYKGKWEPICPETGKNKLLWLMIELGEAADIIKKDGTSKVMENDEVRTHFIEEMCDVLMYFNDVMRCYDISVEELKRVHLAKHERNMKRW